jgi:hypothetical protein
MILYKMNQNSLHHRVPENASWMNFKIKDYGTDNFFFQLSNFYEVTINCVSNLQIDSGGMDQDLLMLCKNLWRPKVKATGSYMLYHGEISKDSGIYR